MSRTRSRGAQPVYDRSVVATDADLAGLREIIEDKTLNPDYRFGAWREWARQVRRRSERGDQVHYAAQDNHDQGGLRIVCVCTLVVPCPDDEEDLDSATFLTAPGHLRLPEMDAVAIAYVGEEREDEYVVCCHQCGLLPATHGLAQTHVVAARHDQGIHDPSPMSTRPLQ